MDLNSKLREIDAREREYLRQREERDRQWNTFDSDDERKAFLGWASQNSDYKGYDFGYYRTGKRNASKRDPGADNTFWKALHLFKINTGRAQEGKRPLRLGDPSLDPKDYTEEYMELHDEYVRKYGAPKAISDVHTYATRKKFKDQYDLTTVEDQENYDLGRPPKRVQIVMDVTGELKDYAKKHAALANDPAATRKDFEDLFNSYKWIPELTRYAKAAAKKADEEQREREISGGGGYDSTLLMGTKKAVANKGFVDVEALKGLGYDERRGFEGLLDDVAEYFSGKKLNVTVQPGQSPIVAFEGRSQANNPVAGSINGVQAQTPASPGTDPKLGQPGQPNFRQLESGVNAALEQQAADQEAQRRAFHAFLDTFSKPDLKKQTGTRPDGTTWTMGSDIKPTEVVVYGRRFDTSLLDDPQKVNAFLEYYRQINMGKQSNFGKWFSDTLGIPEDERGDYSEMMKAKTPEERRAIAEQILKDYKAGNVPPAELISPFTPEGAGLTNFANAGSFGLYEQTAKNDFYNPVQLSRELHPTAALVGEAAGTFVTGAGVDRAAAAVIGKLAPRLAATAPILYEALAGASSGAVYSGIRGVVEGKPAEQVAADMLRDGTIGGVFGGAFGAMRTPTVKQLASELDEAARQMKALDGGIKGGGVSLGPQPYGNIVDIAESAGRSGARAAAGRQAGVADDLLGLADNSPRPAAAAAEPDMGWNLVTDRVSGSTYMQSADGTFAIRPSGGKFNLYEYADDAGALSAQHRGAFDTLLEAQAAARPDRGWNLVADRVSGSAFMQSADGAYAIRPSGGKFNLYEFADDAGGLKARYRGAFDTLLEAQDAARPAPARSAAALADRATVSAPAGLWDDMADLPNMERLNSLEAPEVAPFGDIADDIAAKDPNSAVYEPQAAGQIKKAPSAMADARSPAITSDTPRSTGISQSELALQSGASSQAAPGQRNIAAAADDPLAPAETVIAPKTAAGRPVNPKTQEVIGAYARRNRLQSQVDYLAQKYGITAADRESIEAVRQGKFRWDQLAENTPTQEQFENLREFAAKLQELDAVKAEIAQYNAARAEGLNAKMMDLIRNSDNWKDKAKLAYARETWDRNIVDIAGEADGNRVRRELFEPIHRNEAARIRWVNESRDMVRDLKLTTQESALVQQVGEGKLLLTDIPAGQNAQKIQNAVEKLRAWYDDVYDQVNAVLVENGYAPVPKRKNYFPHFLEDDTLITKIKKAFGVDVMNTDLPTDINGLTHTFKPGKRWFGNFLQRQGNATTFDAVQGFDRYVEGVSHVLHHTDDIQRMRAFNRALRGKYSDEGIKAALQEIRNSGMPLDEMDAAMDAKLDYKQKFHLTNAVADLEDYTQVLAGKKSLADRSWEDKLGRGVYRITKNLQGRIARNMVAMNPGSWLTNFIPLQATAVNDTRSVLRAMRDTLRNVYKADDFVTRSTFLTARRGSDPLVKTAVEKISDVASAPMRWIDDFTTEVIARAKYYDGIHKGLAPEDAMRLADDWTAKAVGDRSLGAQPTLFNARNPFDTMITQFQLEVNNQLSFLFKDLPRELRGQGVLRTTAAITKLAVFGYLYNEAYEALTGRRPAVDPIGMAVGFVEDVSGEDGDVWKAFGNLGLDAANNIPFIAAPAAALGIEEIGRLPISAAIPNLPEMAKGGMSTVKEAAKPVAYLLPPVGGGQIKKTVEGVLAQRSGGEYTTNAQGEKQLKYPMEQGPADWAQSILFGKYANQYAREYFDEGRTPLSAANTVKFDKLRKDGIPVDPLWESFQVLAGLEPAAGQKTVTDAQKERAIRGVEGLSPQQQGSIIDLLVYTPKMSDETKAKYARIVSRGVPQRLADRVYTEMNKMRNRVQVLPDHKSLTEAQKRDYIWDNFTWLTEEQRRIVIEELGYQKGK
jgi:hypothetical protein